MNLGKIERAIASLATPLAAIATRTQLQLDALKAIEIELHELNHRLEHLTTHEMRGYDKLRVLEFKP